MTRPNIEIHIERLVLSGSAGVSSRRIREAVERELARLFAEQDSDRSNARRYDSTRPHGRKSETRPKGNTEELGVRVAQRLHSVCLNRT